MEAINNLIDNKVQDPIDSLQLSYTDNIKAKEDRMVRKATNKSL